MTDMNSQADTDLQCSALINVVRRAFAVLGTFEAFAQKAQQLFRGPEAQFASCVDLLNGAGELALLWFGLRCQLKDERAPHHMIKVTRGANGSA